MRSMPQMAALLGRTALVALVIAVVGIAITSGLKVAGGSDVAVFVVAAASVWYGPPLTV